MTEKDLRKLSRADLLEMLIDQSTEMQRIKKRLHAAEARLSNREIAIDESGTLAEAALKLNGIFQAAQASCAQYTENIRLLSGRQDDICRKREEESLRQTTTLLAETKERCAAMEAETKKRCADMEAETEKNCTTLEADVRRRCAYMEAKAGKLCVAMERETENRCTAMEAEAKNRCTEMEAEAKNRCAAMEAETREKCAQLLETAQKNPAALAAEFPQKAKGAMPRRRRRT